MSNLYPSASLIGQTKRCEACGATFFPGPHMQPSRWAQRRFCSRRCSSPSGLIARQAQRLSAPRRYNSDGALIVPVGRDHVALIDENDADLVLPIPWQPRISKISDYVVAVGHVRVGGHRRCIQMHRHILGCGHGDPRQVDHINRNPLDNRRANLRFADGSGNQANKLSPNQKLGKFRGVTLVKGTGKWSARCCLHRCGSSYATAEEAARAYDLLAKKYFGEFALLNFPEREE